MSSSLISSQEEASSGHKDGRSARFYEIVVSFQKAAPAPDVLVAPLLVAMTHFLRIFDALALGDIAQIIKSDVSGNVKKLGDAAALHGVGTVPELLEAEMRDPISEELIRKVSGRGRDSGAVALLWMKRVLSFVRGLVHILLDDPEAALSHASRQSYATSLAPCHNIITRGVFSTGLRFAPSRTVFYENLAGPGNATKVDVALTEFLGAMDAVLNPILALYERYGLETIKAG
jgi:hypothetical protein